MYDVCYFILMSVMPGWWWWWWWWSLCGCSTPLRAVETSRSDIRRLLTTTHSPLPPPPPLPSQNFNCQKIIMYTNRHELSMSCKPTKTSFVNNTKPTSNVEMNQILVLMSAVCFFMYFMRERTMMKYLQQIWEMRKGSERARKILASLHKYCFDWEKSRW